MEFVAILLKIRLQIELDQNYARKYKDTRKKIQIWSQAWILPIGFASQHVPVCLALSTC